MAGPRCARHHPRAVRPLAAARRDRAERLAMHVHPLATVVIFLTALVLGYFVWSRMRRMRVTLLLPRDYELASLFRSLAALTWGQVTEGNRVTIVQNSGFFDAMLDDAA